MSDDPKIEKLGAEGDASRLRRAAKPFLKTWIEKGAQTDTYVLLPTDHEGRKYVIGVWFRELP